MKFKQTDTSREITKYLERRFAFYMNAFKEMVEINSFTLNSNGVTRLGDYTAGLFEELGFHPKE